MGIACGTADGHSRWVAVEDRGRAGYSDNGSSWTGIPAVTVTGFNNTTLTGGMAYGAPNGGGGLFVVVGNAGKMAYSADGVNWTAAGTTAEFGGNFYGEDVIYGGGKFIAGGRSGKRAYSANGVDWTGVEDLQLGVSNYVYGIAYGAADGKADGAAAGNDRFVAGSSCGKIAYSADGITWKAAEDRPFGTSYTASVINGVAYGNGVFVAVGKNGQIAYSANGADWTLAILGVEDDPFEDDVFGVAYGNGGFVAAIAYGKIAYAANGADWTMAADMPFGSANVNCIAYGEGKFAAGSKDGKIAFLDLN
jgi:hypothetical protein